MKKIKALAFITIISLLLTTGCDSKKEEVKKDEVKSNTNTNVIKDQQVEGLSLTNTSLTTTNGQSTLVTVVSNPTTEKIAVKSFDIIIKDKDGNILITLLGYVGEEIPAGESRTITSSAEIDLTKATSVEYTIKK